MSTSNQLAANQCEVSSLRRKLKVAGLIQTCKDT